MSWPTIATALHKETNGTNIRWFSSSPQTLDVSVGLASFILTICVCTYFHFTWSLQGVIALIPWVLMEFFLKDRHISRIFKLLLWIPGYEPLDSLVSFLLYDFCIIFSPLKDLFTAWDDKSSIQVIHGSPHSGVHILRVLRHRTVLKC